MKSSGTCGNIKLDKRGRCKNRNVNQSAAAVVIAEIILSTTDKFGSAIAWLHNFPDRKNQVG